MSKQHSNIFTTVEQQITKMNRFDLAHDVKMSFSMGTLVPSLTLEVIPGDIITMNSENLMRFAPLVSPVMHEINISQHYFFIPNRLLWDEWEDFITGNVDVEPPYFNNPSGAGGIDNGTIGDYIGMNHSNALAIHYSCFPLAAYLLVYDEYYRDQNLQTEQFIPLVSGKNNAIRDFACGPPLRRAWEHDYFTSCLPFAQKGDNVTLPLLNADTAPVELDPASQGTPQIARLAANHTTDPGNGNVGHQAGTGWLDVGASFPAVIDPNGTLTVDINAEAATINTLRRAFKLQEWLEKNARGGTRYIETILSHFDKRSSDARLQRPEYIGGQKQRMSISEVLSTAQTIDQASNDIPIGQMAGRGISSGSGKPFTYSVEEHGWILGITNVQPRTAYFQGHHRSFDRKDKLDYAWPTFANIGEQAVYNKEVYSFGGTTTDLESTFGYIPRYSEYKYMNSRVAGEFKDTLDYWHLGRDFSGTQNLNANFIECVPSNRIFADTSDGSHNIYAHIYNNISAVRKLPKYGTPTI